MLFLAYFIHFYSIYSTFFAHDVYGLSKAVIMLIHNLRNWLNESL